MTKNGDVKPGTSRAPIAALVYAVVGILLCAVLPLLCVPLALVGIALGLYALIDAMGEPITSAGPICALAAFILSIAMFAMPDPAVSSRKSFRCLANVRAQASAMLMYADDNNGRLPLASNWCDSLRHSALDSGYSGKLRAVPMLTCPSLPEGVRGGYAYNSSLSAAKPPTGKTAAKVIMIFESRAELGLHGGRELLLKEPRHRSLSIAFADGHARGMQPSAAKHLLWSAPGQQRKGF